MSMTKPEREIAELFEVGGLTYLDATPSMRRRLVADARKTYRMFRRGFDLDSDGYMLTKPEAQPKTGKSEMYTLILMLKPASTAGIGNICPPSTEGCRQDCLDTAGRGEMSTTQQARLIRTAFLHEAPYSSAIVITHEIMLALRHHDRVGVRLNGVSDLRWELMAPRWLERMMSTGVTFYDYTKWARRLRSQAFGLIHLTLSAHERYEPEHWADLVLQGENVAIVVDADFEMLPGLGEIRNVHLGGVRVPVLNGDLTDDRTTDKPGCLVWLTQKGRHIKSNYSGFVYHYSIEGNMLTPRVLSLV